MAMEVWYSPPQRQQERRTWYKHSLGDFRLQWRLTSKVCFFNAFCQSEYFQKKLNLHRKSKNQNSKNIARTLGHITCELCFSKCKYFNLRRDSVFFPHEIFISKIWHDYFERETIAAYASQNVCIMSILKTSKLLYMRFMALALGAVLIAFFGKKTIWNWFNRKNWLFTCSGRPIGSLSILGVYMLI